MSETVIISESGAHEPAPQERGAGAGAMLTAERLAQGLSLGDIARQLKLSVRQIEALERDDYRAFAGMVFVRGFLRNYAKLLQLDADALLAQVPAPPEPAPQALAIPVSSEAPIGTAWVGRPGMGWVVGAGVLLLLLVASVFDGRQHRRTPEPAPAPLGPIAAVNPQHADSPPPTEPAPAPRATPAQPALPVPPRSAQSGSVQSGSVQSSPSSRTPASADSPAGVAASPSAQAAASASAHATPSKAAAAAQPGVAPAALHPAAATASPPIVAAVLPATAANEPSSRAQDELKLAFDAESWVEVKDRSGQVVFAQLNQPGSEQVVHGQAPFDVVVGNAHGVHIVYRGKAVDLTPHTRVDVARVLVE